MTEVLATVAEVIELDSFANVERNFAKVDGLVVPLERGMRRAGYELHYPGPDQFNNDGLNFTFRIYQQLGVWDESVLLVVLKLIGQRGVVLDPNPAGPNSRQVRDDLNEGGDALAQRTLLLRDTSYSEILRHMALNPVGRSRRMLRESLQRLSAITLWVKDRAGNEGNSNLLVARASSTGDLRISVHYLLAKSFLSETLWARIDLSERWRLPGDTAKILHRWLSAWLDGGETQPAKLSTLERHVWGDISIGMDRAKRFYLLRQALREIEALGGGWKVSGADQRGDPVCSITRRPRSTPVDRAENRPVLIALGVGSDLVV